MKKIIVSLLAALFLSAPIAEAQSYSLWISTEGAGMVISGGEHHHMPPPPPRRDRHYYKHHGKKHDHDYRKAQKRYRKSQERYRKAQEKYYRDNHRKNIHYRHHDD